MCRLTWIKLTALHESERRATHSCWVLRRGVGRLEEAIWREKGLRVCVLVSVWVCSNKHQGRNSGKSANVGFFNYSCLAARLWCDVGISGGVSEGFLLLFSLLSWLSDGADALESPASFKKFWSSAAGGFFWLRLWWFDVSTRLKVKRRSPTSSQQPSLLGANKIDGNSSGNDFSILESFPHPKYLHDAVFFLFFLIEKPTQTFILAYFCCQKIQ